MTKNQNYPNFCLFVFVGFNLSIVNTMNANLKYRNITDNSFTLKQHKSSISSRAKTNFDGQEEHLKHFMLSDFRFNVYIFQTISIYLHIIMG